MRIDLADRPLSAVALGFAAAMSSCTIAANADAAVVTVDFDALDGGRTGINVERPARLLQRRAWLTGLGPGSELRHHLLRAPRQYWSQPSSATTTGSATTRPPETRSSSSATVRTTSRTRASSSISKAASEGSRGVRRIHQQLWRQHSPDRDQDRSEQSVQHRGRHRIPQSRSDRRLLQDQCAFIHYVFDITTDPRFPDDIVAHDIIIHTDRADAVIIDKIVFHDLILPDEDTPPVVIAEPSSALMFGGIGLIAAMLRRRFAQVRGQAA